MIIDIQRTVIKTQLRRLLTLVVFIAIIMSIVLLGDSRERVLGMNKYHWAVIAGIVYGLTLLIEAFFELNYIYFSDDSEQIVLRYFSMSVLNRKKNSIEIPKRVFRGYEIQEEWFGMKKKIVLMQQLKGQDVKYPPVSISGLNAKEVQLLRKVLDSYKQQAGFPV